MTGERGSVLLESLLAVTILVVAIVPAFGMLALAPSAQAQATQSAQAENIARAQLEKYENIGTSTWDNLQTADLTPSADVSSTLNALKIHVNVMQPDASLNLKDVTVIVSWQDGHGKDQQVQLATSVARR